MLPGNGTTDAALNARGRYSVKSHEGLRHDPEIPEPGGQELGRDEACRRSCSDEWAGQDATKTKIIDLVSELLSLFPIHSLASPMHAWEGLNHRSGTVPVAANAFSMTALNHLGSTSVVQFGFHYHSRQEPLDQSHLTSDPQMLDRTSRKVPSFLCPKHSMRFDPLTCLMKTKRALDHDAAVVLGGSFCDARCVAVVIQPYRQLFKGLTPQRRPFATEISAVKHLNLKRCSSTQFFLKDHFNVVVSDAILNLNRGSTLNHLLFPRCRQSTTSKSSKMALHRYGTGMFKPHPGLML